MASTRFFPLIPLLCATAVVFCTAQAQTEHPTLPRHHLGADASVNSNDVFTGMVFHIADAPAEDFSIMLSVNFRPFGKKLLVLESPGSYLYVREQRVTLLAGIDRQMALTETFSLFGNLQAGWTFPWYRGSSRQSSSVLAPVAAAGFQWSLPEGTSFAGDAVALRLGGTYLNLDDDAFRIYCAVLIAL